MTTTTTTSKFKNLIVSKGKVKFLAIAKPRAAYQNKTDLEGNVIMEYSIRLELPTNAIGKLGTDAPTNLKELIRSIEGKVRPSMSKINPDKETATTFELGFKSKKQPSVVVGSGATSRELTQEEIQQEFGMFNSKEDSAEASVIAVVKYNDDPKKSPSIYLQTVNILSSNITPKERVSTLDSLDELNALYNA